MSSRIQERFTVLLVEDDPADRHLTATAFAGHGAQIDLQIATGGPQALQVLRECRDTLPDLILLDLNMPAMNGFEVLQVLKHHELWKLIPVVVLTTSEARVDVTRAYALGANAFVSKPLRPDEYTSRLESLLHFWGTVAHLP